MKAKNLFLAFIFRELKLMIREALSFDDVLLVPKYSEVYSRSNVDTTVIFKSDKFEFVFRHPIIPANMRDISGVDLVKAIAKDEGLGLLHRFMDYKYIISLSEELIKEHPDNIGYSVGVKNEDYNLVESLIKNGAKIICIDVAHGHHIMVKNMINHIRFCGGDNILIIAGNVATSCGAKYLWDNGANIVKCGIGNGGLCTTRIVTGIGVPQFTAICDIWDEFELLKNPSDKGIISDGSIKSSGDIGKALTKSHMVMSGGQFAGTIEASGKTIINNGIICKEYAGSSTHKTSHIEGVKANVPIKGSCIDVVNNLLEGLKSTCSYQDVSNLEDLKLDPIFVKISNSGLKESHSHNSYVVK
jgi:IMP dehydrogenase